MRITYEVYVNENNGEVNIENIGETNLASQYINRIQRDNTYVGFHCKKEEIPKMFETLKNREIKDRKKEIKKLQKEIMMFEKINLPVLI